MGIGVDCSSTKTIQMVCLVFLLYGYQYRFIVRNTVHQVSARRAFSNVNPAFVPANRCFKQVLWDCCHVLVNQLPRYTELFNRLGKFNNTSFFALVYANVF